MYSQLSNLFAGMAVIFVVLIAYFIASLIANYMLLGKIGRKKWPGLIPYVNDYFLFDSFWNNKVFAAWIVMYILTVLCVKSNNHTLVIIGMILSMSFTSLIALTPIRSTVAGIDNLSTFVSTKASSPIDISPL